MSLEAVQMVIGRAATDAEFREALIQNAAKACKGYDLTSDELAALEALDAESLKAFAGTLDKRIQKGHSIGLGV
ncbi:MAG: Franean1_4349 family RiPP [Anaerolineae bacterium]|jgi:hypothetical protein|nr:Franean1_4349 family RiPP [Anaerolineae bacterium]MDH7472527.1 Franean1_4349 family RiPP [Anaerolineae bacterium]